MADATDTKTCDFAEMSRPTEAHERLKAFEGTFSSRVQLWMGPGEPQVSTGTMVNTLELGGLFLHQHYTGDPGAAGSPFPEFAGRGYMGFNKATGKYEGFWIDTASSIMQVEAGDVDPAGKVWTMHSEMPNQMCGDGGTIKKKSIITLQDNNHHSLEMYFEGPDGSMQKGMEIQYTRKT